MDGSSSNPKPQMGANGGKPDFWQDCLIYGVKPWEDGAEEFWHGLNRELVKQEKYEARAAAKQQQQQQHQQPKKN